MTNEEIVKFIEDELDHHRTEWLGYVSVGMTEDAIKHEAVKDELNFILESLKEKGVKVNV